MISLEVDSSEEIPCRSIGPNDSKLEEQIIQHMATALANASSDQKRALLFQLMELNSEEGNSLLLLPLLSLPPTLTSASFPYHVSWSRQPFTNSNDSCNQQRNQLLLL